MYLDDRGGVRPPREQADFRGTSLYSSLHAHQQRDLGRRDDLWSLFYVFVDMARGGLPWCVLRGIVRAGHPAGLAQLFGSGDVLLTSKVHGLPRTRHASATSTSLPLCPRTAGALHARIDPCAARSRLTTAHGRRSCLQGCRGRLTSSLCTSTSTVRAGVGVGLGVLGVALGAAVVSVCSVTEDARACVRVWLS